jgi:predicted DNA-binding transcriptional regulator AlpA
MNEAIAGKALGLTAVKGKLLTIKEVAAFLRVSDRWVQLHMNDGTFPLRWFPIGERDRVVDSADLDTWLSKIFFKAGTAPLPKKAERKLKKEATMK